jgi:putative ABC transport system ATP-binding protein
VVKADRKSRSSLRRGSAPLGQTPATGIALRGVSRFFYLGDEKIHALRNASLDIDQGEYVAITGPSGSGKSTLANLIAGLDTPNEGSITVGDMELATATDLEHSWYRAHTVGFVFQSFNLQAHLTVAENVMLPLVIAGVRAEDRRDRVMECLEMVGLADRADQMVNKLSGGQRQRVSIARALSNNPRLLIADEPTGNLDSVNGESVMKTLTSLNRDLGITLLLITHDAKIAASAPRVIELVDGVLTDRRQS